MDATEAALIGAGIGAGGSLLTAILTTTTNVLWDGLRNERQIIEGRRIRKQDMEEARAARLLDRRLAAHEALLADMAWFDKVIKIPFPSYQPEAKWPEMPAGEPDHVLLKGHVARMAVLSSGETVSKAELLVWYSNRILSHVVITMELSLTYEEGWWKVTSDYEKARKDYLEAVHREIGVI